MSPLLRVSILAFAAVLSAKAQDAPDAAAQQAAYRNSIAEESVRKQTDKIQVEITQLIEELKLNGIDSADAQVLADASNHLQSLSQHDMQKVIVALQSASMSVETAERKKAMVTAYQGQKGVSIKLKSLAANLAAREGQKEIPSKLENLIARQAANIRQTKTLGSAAAEKLDTPQKSTHDVASAEQAAIGGEIDILYKLLAAKPDTGAKPDPADTTKAVLEALTANPVQATATQATDSTSKGPFPDAVGKQTEVEKYLTAALRAAMSNADAVSRLQQAQAQLEQIIGDEKDLTSVTQEARLDGSTLGERQSKIGDRTQVTQALLRTINVAAAGQLDAAQGAITESSAALNTGKSPVDAVPKEKTVVDALEKAAADLEQQLAAAQKQADASPTDKLAQLQQLQKELDDAQKDPSKADLDKLQQDANAVSPQAANQVANAADQMQQQNQAAAQQALAQASQTAQQQAAALQQAAQNYQQLAQVQQALQQAQQQAQAASQSMQQTPNSLTQAARNLTQAQQNVAQAQQAAQQASQPQTPQQPQAGQQQSAQQQAGQQQAGQQQTVQQSGQQQAGQQQAGQQQAGQQQQQTAQQSGQQQAGQPQAGQQQAGQQQSAQNSQAGSPQAGVPQSAQQAMQQASNALSAAAMQAVQAQAGNAQADDQQALAALAQAQQGVQQAMAQAQAAGQQAMGQGQQQGQQMAQQGQGQGQGQQQKGQQTSQGSASDAADTQGGLLSGIGGGGTGQVMGGLKPKDRDAITQYQAEKSPPEYAPLVQQYLKNLADSKQ